MIVCRLRFSLLLSRELVKVTSKNFVQEKTLSSCTNLLLRSRLFSTRDTGSATLNVDIKNVDKSIENEENCSVKRISNILECSQDEGRDIINNYPALRNTPSRNVLKRVQFLKEKNISSDVILNNPWLLIGDKRKLKIYVV